MEFKDCETVSMKQKILLQVAEDLYELNEFKIGNKNFENTTGKI